MNGRYLLGSTLLLVIFGILGGVSLPVAPSTAIILFFVVLVFVGVYAFGKARGKAEAFEQRQE